MDKIVKRILSPSKEYKVEIIKRHDGLYTTEVSRWIEWDDDYAYEYWSPTKQGLSLIDTEERAIKIGIEQLKEYSGELID
ncbi:hypothetical protein OZL92_06025 [Bacillus sonorensis]|uniref:Uncharacterized protein n=1 Tax=Bacillus sonorensis L12 TaxID=1274524 RepID=M5P354_9BACI|nr:MULTISPECIES: hypothetical protein [Bacillus]TWK83642.1 hypothetical protein CHCC20335_4713 [Bacillus paralicheniformis]EME73868.1 hypothetical protein BSONL12_19204 [Bacillus sonorensis L12]MBG9914802.1 hypothetical protein [Bacillus sonorensis]MCF7615895.1 hypothetical protein [Bacillus sonorensis]MCY7858182.1 hypothetical protein [Bacillus sonorensis]